MGKVSPYIQAGSLTAPHLAVGQLVYLASARGISLQPSAVKDWVEFDRFGAMHMSTTGVIYSCYLYKGATTDKPLSPEDQQGRISDCNCTHIRIALLGYCVCLLAMKHIFWSCLFYCVDRSRLVWRGVNANLLESDRGQPVLSCREWSQTFS
jgi:hypothetical protein